MGTWEFLLALEHVTFNLYTLSSNDQIASESHEIEKLLAKEKIVIRSSDINYLPKTPTGNHIDAINIDSFEHRLAAV